MATHRVVYVWELPVRITHWVSAFAIAVLCVTGAYIGDPYVHAIRSGDMTMAWFRHSHFLAGWLLVASLIVRVYWLYAGNKYAKLNQIIPMTRARWRNLTGTLKFYLFLRRHIPRASGHTALAGASYFAFFGMCAVEILTGFALLGQSEPGVLHTLLGGWLVPLVSAQVVRYVHHAVMWAVVLFVIAHLYIDVHNDIIEKTGLTSSIINGYKVFGVWRERHFRH